MHGPALVGWLLAAVCALAAAVCLARARHAGGRAGRQAAGAEAFMGLAMAVMVLPGAALPTALYLALSGLSGAGALALLPRGAPHQGHHLAEACAMGYMAVVMGAGHGGGHPLATGALLLYFAGYALTAGARLLPAAPAVAGGHTAPVAGAPAPLAALPEVADACRLALTLAMCAMLLGM
ncbi:DUF5134 domain-containing protein [Streptomyces sp. TRM 70351]|uniref:DUF5134 domain-containing protein n=1 Tax=Streptomyces sp. TRM 70351 TaxID=3116552 RepID=UPI002E7BDA05|nr:DUF5134 domain-containing protein [Streptomyces sp. TRM 70351]MEE1927246.1 DUF5134 domain-containing protein [Streptomyces sp. TRM 70351]